MNFHTYITTREAYKRPRAIDIYRVAFTDGVSASGSADIHLLTSKPNTTLLTRMVP